MRPVTAVSSANLTSADLDNSLLLVRVQAYLKWHLYRWRFALFLFFFTPQNFKKWFPLRRLNNIFFIKFRNVRKKKHTPQLFHYILDSILLIYLIAISPSPAAFQKPTKTSHVAHVGFRCSVVGLDSSAKSRGRLLLGFCLVGIGENMFLIGQKGGDDDVVFRIHPKILM